MLETCSLSTRRVLGVSEEYWKSMGGEEEEY